MNGILMRSQSLPSFSAYVWAYFPILERLRWFQVDWAYENTPGDLLAAREFDSGAVSYFLDLNKDVLGMYGGLSTF